MESPEAKASESVILMRDVAVSSMQDPSATILTGINWQAHAADFWVIAGLQGEGKSDFMMMAAGLMPPQAGEYLLFGTPMPIFDEERLPVRLRLGLLFETGQLLNHLTVRENLALPVRYHRNLSKAEAEPGVQAMLEVMELGPWADTTPGALGRNWQKRVGLARALMLKPEVLLIDSPLAGLDLRHASWWLNFLDRLSKPGNFVRAEALTLVVTTADLRPWLDLGRQFAILKDKRLTVLGDRAQLESATDELMADLLLPERRNG